MSPNHHAISSTPQEMTLQNLEAHTACTNFDRRMLHSTTEPCPETSHSAQTFARRTHLIIHLHCFRPALLHIDSPALYPACGTHCNSHVQPAASVVHNMCASLLAGHLRAKSRASEPCSCQLHMLMRGRHVQQWEIDIDKSSHYY